MLAGQITRYARIAIDRPGVVSYILLPSPAPNRQGTPGRGSRHLRMGGRAPRQVVAGTRICRILGRLRAGRPPPPPQGFGSVVWLPVWLPNDRKRAGIHTLSRAPSRTRTYGLLLRRHSRNAARRCPVWPDVPFRCNDNGWIWPGAALRLWALAPSLAPTNLSSNANVPSAGDVKGTSYLAGRGRSRGVTGDGLRMARQGRVMRRNSDEAADATRAACSSARRISAGLFVRSIW